MIQSNRKISSSPTAAKKIKKNPMTEIIMENKNEELNDGAGIVSNPKFQHQTIISRRLFEAYTKSKNLQNHDSKNVRFNVAASEPISTKNYTKEDNLSELRTFFQGEESETGLAVNTRTASCLAPAMRMIIGVLSTDKESMFLGSLPRHLERAARMPLESPQVNLEILAQELNHINYPKFKSKYLNSAEGANKMHAYLSNCSRAEAQVVGDLIKADLENLITQKFGHSIIRSLIGVNPELKNQATNLCVHNFCALAADEFASRVMQRLVEESGSFKMYALKRFYKNSSLWLRNVAGLFILTACMRCSDSHEYQFVIELLLSDPKKTLSSKIMKRALVSVIDACSYGDLNYIFGFLNINSGLMRYLEDKFMTYVLIAFMRRDYMPAVGMLARHISNNLKDLLAKRYFKLLANKLVSVGSEQVLEAINQSLVSISSQALFKLCDNGDNLLNLYYFTFLALSTFSPESACGTQRLLEFARTFASNPDVIRLDAQLAFKISQCFRP